MNRSLRTVLALRFAAISLLPGLVMAALVVALLMPRLEQRVVEAHGALAATLALEAERYLQQPVLALRGLATVMESLPPGDVAQAGRLLQSLVLGGNSLAGAFVLDAEGRLTDIALPPDARKLPANYLGLDLSSNPVVAPAHRTGERLWSAAYLSGVTEQITVAATIPLGRRLLVGEIGIARLSGFVRNIATSPSMRLMIIDGRGQIIAHPDPAVARQQLNLGRLPILEQAASQTGGGMVTASFDFEGLPVIGAARLIPGTDWTVLVTEPLAEVRRPIWEILIGLALVGAFSAVLAVGVAALMADGFSRRFSRLTLLARELAAGAYPEAWPQSRVREAANLIDSIRQMADAVRQREHELRELNAALEMRVAQRTDELLRSNVELSSAMDALEQAQSELFQSEKLAALGSLVAGVAHELNTPIGNSLMVASTLQDRIDEFEAGMTNGLTRSSLTRYLGTSREAATSLVRNLQRAAELIISFKQVAVDRTTSQRRRFALEELISEVVVTLSPALRNLPWRVETVVPPGIVLDSYPGPLGQVLTNLMNNALLHAFEGMDHGTVRLEASLTDDGAGVRLVVADDGCGIPAEHLGRIFDPFFTTRMGRGGTGLGLSICHNIVEGILGGRIGVASTPGEGTVFSLTVPLTAPEHPDGEVIA